MLEIQKTFICQVWELQGFFSQESVSWPIGKCWVRLFRYVIIFCNYFGEKYSAWCRVMSSYWFKYYVELLFKLRLQWKAGERESTKVSFKWSRQGDPDQILGAFPSCRLSHICINISIRLFESLCRLSHELRKLHISPTIWVEICLFRVLYLRTAMSSFSWWLHLNTHTHTFLKLLFMHFFVQGRWQPTQSQLIQIYSVDWTEQNQLAI